MRLVKSEWFKLIHVRAHWGLIFAASLISVIPVVITPFIISNDSELLALAWIKQRQLIPYTQTRYPDMFL